MPIYMLLQFLFFVLLLTIISIRDSTHAYSQCRQDQRSLLLELKNELVFESSASRKLVQWDRGDDCCIWKGVECDGAGYVIGLQLDSEAISGGLENSSSLFLLGYLQKLNLAFNTFYNTQIPRDICNLKYLTHLNLSNAGFGGQVPVELSFLRRLLSLDVSSPYTAANMLLTLEYQNFSMFLQNLTRLRELYLENLDISARGSEWGRVISSSLPDLRILSLQNCNLSGPLDSSLVQLRSLSVLRLDWNNLSTVVPNFLSNFSSLTTLTLASCSLEGSFPELIFKVPTLQNLDLFNNPLLSGSIPLFPLTGSFRSISLGRTNFSGTLPNSISNLRMLSEIVLSGCRFTGPIPSTLANLTELLYVDLSDNFFTGLIPLFYMSRKLTYIDLSRNNLTGSLSSMHFQGLSSLVLVNVGYNSLNGSIPMSLFRLPSLQTLLLYNNQFSGRLDEFSTLEYSSKMDELDLSSNRLEGPIPESFFELESLAILFLSKNLFNGTFQLGKIQKLHRLMRLDLSYNNLSVDASSIESNSSLPPLLELLSLASCNLHGFPDLRNQSNLYFLDLSNNRITGEIPSWIWGIGSGTLSTLNLSYNLLMDLQKPYYILDSLRILDLHANQLRGELPLHPIGATYVDYSNNNFRKPIPPNIGNFSSSLAFLSLANSSLIGAIPFSLCNATSLEILDLSFNSLSGIIPPCLLDNIKNLGVLNLGANNIGGDIPDRFSANCSLKTFDLSDNNISGNIPKSLANCNLLEFMNVGNNNMYDTFPCTMLSPSLHVLVLRSNRFHGEVRCQKSWPNLQIIDIASNNLEGHLNLNFSSWKGMVLDNNNTPLLRSDDLGFSIVRLNFYYLIEVALTIKGLELKLVKIATEYTSIDFSHNNFNGEIPDSISDLRSLYLLNLSNNAFTGRVPNSFGNLMQLGSLDLSVNELTGPIPTELVGLTFLSVLNLSYNKLVGVIPRGSQFETFSADSFKGNTELCGFPLNRSCDHKTDSSNGKMEIEWNYVSVTLGYVVGLGSFVWVLLGCHNLRLTYFEKVDQVFERIFRRRGRRVVMR